METIQVEQTSQSGKLRKVGKVVTLHLEGERRLH